MGLRRQKGVFENDSFDFVELEFELDSFCEYLKITNIVIEKKLKSEISEFNKYHDILGGDEDSISLLFDPFEIDVKQRSLRLYYSSILISLYSFLEQSMLRLCQIVEPNNILKVNDIAGKGIFKFKAYLEKVVCLDFEPINYEWNEITKLNHLRNHFVHTSNAEIQDTESRKRRNSISEIKNIRLEYLVDQNCHVIQFDNDAVIKHYISIIRSFLDELYHEDDNFSSEKVVNTAPNKSNRCTSQ